MAEDGESESTFRTRNWYRRRDVRFLIVVGVCLGIFFGYGFVTGPLRMTDELKQALADGADRVNIVVTAKFPPEEFHLGVYQDVGNMRGNKGRSSTLFAVKRGDVRALSRHYWIEKIDLAPPER